ncbi:MAG: hypothetical protein ACREBD_39070, partial [Blastocatellia bacterium]
GNGCGRGKPAPTLLLQLIFKHHKPTAKLKAPLTRQGAEQLRMLFEAGVHSRGENLWPTNM